MSEKKEKPIEGDVDYRALYGKDYIGAWDLTRDVTMTIERVVRAELRPTEEGKAPDQRPVIYFKGYRKGFVLNATNGATVAGMYGTKVSGWIGKRITIYATKTRAFGKEHDCIRVRPKVPAMKGPDGKLPDEPQTPSVPIAATASEAAPDHPPSSYAGDDTGEVPGL